MAVLLLSLILPCQLPQAVIPELLPGEDLAHMHTFLELGNTGYSTTVLVFGPLPSN